MSYQVLARKWRPRSFTELVGQDHVRRALTNALDSDRLHHAFLFTGTRGVGKTTIARILAKSLNCEAGVSSTPCDQCPACTEINEGRFVDLIEVDAASRTKVEDTRDLLENVQYAPTRGRYKVYLIDEVHMLSTHSFNALLKTLEEPPPHVKFLLATTDPQKLPVTILSRCLQFNLKRLGIEQIQEQLAHILKAEGIKSESGALLALARAADGSMRDALSLMDQAIAYAKGDLGSAEVNDMLGTIDNEHVLDLLQALAEQDGSRLLQLSHLLAEQAADFSAALDSLNSQLHLIALAQTVPNGLAETTPQIDRIQALAQNLSPEDVQLFYQIGLLGRRDLNYAPDPRSGFEMILLRMLAFQPSDATSSTAQPQVQSPAKKHVSTAALSNESKPAPATKPAAIPTPAANSGTNSTWDNLVLQLNLVGITQQLAMNCAAKTYAPPDITLNIAETHKQLLSDKRQEALAKAVEQHLGQNVKLSIEVVAEPGATPADMQRQRAEARQQSAETAIQQDPAVQGLIDAFDAQITPNSIQPLD